MKPSRDGSLELDWADGTYTFRLAWGELIKLQEECDAGPFEVLIRLSNNKWKVQEISHVMRLGLIGGGLEPAKALTMVRNYVETRPPLENLTFARGILGIALQGVPDEKPGEADAAPETETATE